MPEARHASMERRWQAHRSGKAGFPGRRCEEVFRKTAATLKLKGSHEPFLAAARLVEAATGLTRLDALRTPDLEISADQVATLAAYVERHLAGEPVSRILGWREFYGRRFQISPAVLDPRPDSELLIDTVLGLVRTGELQPAPRILDFGTGSGVLLLTLLAELPQAHGVGVDTSPEALAMAAVNAEFLGSTSDRRLEWRLSDGLGEIEGQFDLLISNPPYIPSSELGVLEGAVRNYDPSLALDGGCDGLFFYRQIAASAHRLVPEGFIVLEVGAGQARDVSELMRLEAAHSQILRVDTARDLLGHERCVAVQTRTLRTQVTSIIPVARLLDTGYANTKAELETEGCPSTRAVTD